MVRRVVALGFALLAVVCAREAWAACHVVRAGANGTGAEWASALGELPPSLTRGDVYYLAAGTYGPHGFADPDSGTQTIEIRAATAADHCTDTGWDASYAGQVVFSATPDCGSIFNFDTDYYVIDGQSRGSDWKSGYGIKLDNTSRGACEADISGGLSGTGVHDLRFQYVELEGSHPTGDTCNEEGVELLNGSHDIAFRHGWNHDVGNANFFIRGGSNITLEYNWIADDYSSPAVHGEGCSCSEGIQNFTIRYNVWADMVGTAYLATPSGGGK